MKRNVWTQRLCESSAVGKMTWLATMMVVSNMAAADLTSIVCEGDNVPGVPGTQVTSVQVFAINDAEDVVGELSYSGGSMIFRGNPTGSTLEKVIAVGDVVSGAGLGSATVSYFQDAQVASDGQVLVTAGLDVGGSFPERAVLFGAPGNLTVQAYRGGSIAGYNINNIHQVEMNRSGTIAFSVGIDDGSTFTRGIWQNGVLIAKPGVHYTGLPAGEGFSAISAATLLNDAGELVFGATTEPLGGGSLRSGIWTRSVGGVYEQVMEVFRPEDIPGLPDGSNLQNPGVTTFASGPMTGFTAFISGSGITFSDDFGWFVHDGTTIKLIAREGTAAPGVAGAVFPQAANGFDVDAMGRAMLLLRLPTGGDIDSSNDKGVWVWDGAALTLKIREGDAAPGAPGHTIGTIDSSRLTSDGQLLVQASVSGASTVFKGSVTGGLQPIAGPGFTLNAPVDPTTVEHAGYGANDPNHSEGSAQSASASGLVAMEVFLPGLIECVAVNLAPATGPGSISGQVRQDLDGDGDFADAEDTPFAGAVLRLFADDGTGTITPTGPELDSVQPDSGDGYYEFTNVPAGTYVIIAEATSEATASGFSLNAPAGGKRLSVVTADTTDSGNDFLFTIPVSFSLLALHQDWLSGNSADTSPLVPSADTAVLVQQPALLPGGGLSTDGVSPLVIKVFLLQHPVDRPLRWECSVESGGSVTSGIYSHMRSLVSGVWTPASDTNPNVLQPIAAGQPNAGTAFVSVFPMEANDITLTTPERELNLRLRIFDNASGVELGSNLVPIKIRRPPVFLLTSVPGETWGADFVNGLQQSRAADHIRSLVADSTPLSAIPAIGPYIDIDDLLADLGWNAEVDDIRQYWAMTRPDVIGHGRGGLMIQGLSLRDGDSDLDSYFRTSKNFGRGRYRRAITIGTPHLTRYGIIPTYMFLMEKEIAALSQSNPGNPIRLPESFKKVPVWQLDPTARPLLGQTIRDRSRPIDYDLLTPIHLIASRIDSANSDAFPLIGFTPLAQSVLTPEGTDGVVSVTDALLGNTGFLSMSTLPGYIAHGEDRAVFNNAPVQTNSTDVAQHSVFILDQAGSDYFLTANDLQSVNDGGGVKANVEALLEGLEIIVQQTLNSHTATLAPVASGISEESERSMDRGSTISAASSQVIEVQRPEGAPITAGPYWYAEVFGPDGVTSTGVTLTPDVGNPNQVTVDIDGSVVGDVVLYASYLAGDTTVFAPPLRIATIEPPSVTATSLTLQPVSTVLDVGNEITPALWVNYSDGSTLRRWVHPDDIMVSSSSPGVVDVSNETRWRAVSAGQATVTLSYSGLSAQSLIQVVDSTSLRTYSQWKSVMFSPDELADALISGDMADLDNDGIDTFREFIVGGNPRLSNPNHLPRIATVDLGEGPRPALIVRLARRVTSERIDIEQSGDLSLWTDLLPWPDAAPAETGSVLKVREFEDYYEIWFDIGNPLSGRHFFRLGINNDDAPAFTPTGTTEFTFGGFSSTGYGDRVTGTMDGSFVYGGESGFSPNIEAVFVGFTSAWTTGFGDLQHVIYASGGGPLRIDLVGDFGFAVQLDHFDLAGYTVDRTIDRVEIQDGNGTVLWSQENVVAPGSSHLRLDFSGLNLASNILTIIVDGTNIPSGSDEVGLDNLQFKQVPTTTLGNWSMLTFESGQSSYVDLDPNYGDRITSATMGSFSYVGAGSFTPGIVADYLPSASMVHTIDYYGLLQHVIYKKEFFATPFEIQLTADPGQEVRLLGFDLAGYSPSDYTVNSVKVLDALSGELFSELNFHIAGERTRIDFSGAPLRSSQITIQIDSTNLGSSSDNVAIDNISFEQVAAP